MYRYILILILFIGRGTIVYSDEPHDTEIKNLIEKVKSAPASQRRVEMNALKMKLRSMNRESRRAVMMDLKKSFSKNKGLHLQNKAGQNCKNKSQKIENPANKIHNKLPQEKQKEHGKHKNRPNKQHSPKS